MLFRSCHWVTRKETRFQIEISQKDPKILYKIKKHLGFGNVIKYSKKKSRDVFYWRYSTGRFENIQRLILLFNGNFISVYKHTMLCRFIENFKSVHNKAISLKPRLALTPLKMQDNYWLSGFLEGDGGFYAKQPLNPNKKTLSTGLVIKFYVTQKDELVLLNHIRTFFQMPCSLGTLTNGQTNVKYNRVETCNLKSLILVKKYLQTYPFLGQRGILIKRWIRLIDYKLNDYPLTVTSSKKLTRLVLGTKR